jgi:hypothetical protein
MSRSVQDYWREIRAMEDRLPEFVWLVSQAEGAMAFLTQAPAAVAARLLKAKSHRIATEDEIQAHLEREQAAVKTAKQERMRRSGLATVVVEAPEATPEPSPKRRR